MKRYIQTVLEFSLNTFPIPMSIVHPVVGFVLSIQTILVIITSVNHI